MAIEDFYTSGFSIYEKVSSVDNGGAPTPQYQVSISSLSGLLRALGGNERKLNDKLGVESTHRFYCSTDNSITETDVLKDSSNYYDIIFVDNVHGLNRFLTIDCKYNPSLQEEISENEVEEE